MNSFINGPGGSAPWLQVVCYAANRGAIECHYDTHRRLVSCDVEVATSQDQQARASLAAMPPNVITNAGCRFAGANDAHLTREVVFGSQRELMGLCDGTEAKTVGVSS